MGVVARSCIQGSYRFLDPKVKTFSRLLPKQYFIFPDSRLTNRCAIETLKRKTHEPSFFHAALRTHGNHSAMNT